MTTTNQRAVELAPCPWCGDELAGVSVSEGSTFRWRKVDGCCTDGPEVRHDTMADDQASAEADSYARAITAWNRRTPGWRPISEAPRDGRPIMVFNPNWSVKVGMAGWDAHENAWRVHGYGCVPSQPTLFQPLPPPPGEG